MRRKQDLEKVEQILTARKKELEEEFVRLDNEKISDDQVQDSADQASTAISENLKSSLQENELGEYWMIINALEQIKRGDYGICADCEQPIAPKRLESYPNAARCVLCQEATEDSSARENSGSFL